MQFIIQGKIKPAVRMTNRGKWTNPDAQEYLASQTAIGLQVKRQMADNDWQMLPEKTPLKLEATVIVPNRLYTFDIDNAGKAIIDSIQGIVLKNDLWIIEARFTKVLGSDYQAFVFVEAVK